MTSTVMDSVDKTAVFLMQCKSKGVPASAASMDSEKDIA